MSTVLTPPPAPPAPADASSAPQPGGPTRSSSRAVAITASIAGGVIVAGALGFGALAAIAGLTSHSATYRVAVEGVTSLDVDFSAGDMMVEYGDVAEAVLDVKDSTGVGEWDFRVEAGELIAASPSGAFGLGWFNRGGTVTLTLPIELEGLDARLDIGAGSLDVEGTFDELIVGLGAGDLSVRGVATAVNAEISAGDALLALDDVRTADLTVSAGRLVASFTGDQPEDIRAAVSAGGLELVVPDGQYAVTDEVSAGSFDNNVGSAPDASSRIHVEVSAGNATLDQASTAGR